MKSGRPAARPQTSQSPHSENLTRPPLSRGRVRRILVANRAEIACRIFQACRELGIESIALAAPGDEQARHLTYADYIAPVASYLDAEAIVAAAKTAGADLIHPGYGFLSERPHFARAVEKAGIQFIGPVADTMDLMGGKIAAKQIAEKAGVPTLPWAIVKDNGELKKAASKTGFPLLLKASAGGGGKGMRRVDREEDLMAAAESATAEAQAAFGDGTLFIEKLLINPRHIEIQVFGDGQGDAVHFYERECSLQRRHQKVWEEACAPHLEESAKQGLYKAALALTRQVKYRSAGTLEFLVDASGGFYFLEMNTRLQVEHPVTELVTGVDLVHAQIRLALGEKISTWENIGSPRGHAIEVRLYAEDPFQGFVPTPGRIDLVRWPTGPGIRVDSGIEPGQELGTQFDSMLGKLIVWAPDRASTVARMKFALGDTVILGSQGFGTNLSYLRSIAEMPEVVEGRVHIGLLDQSAQRVFRAPNGQELQAVSEILGRGAQVPSAGYSGPANSSGAAAAGVSGLVGAGSGVGCALTRAMPSYREMANEPWVSPWFGGTVAKSGGADGGIPGGAGVGASAKMLWSVSGKTYEIPEAGQGGLRASSEPAVEGSAEGVWQTRLAPGRWWVRSRQDEKEPQQRWSLQQSGSRISVSSGGYSFTGETRAERRRTQRTGVEAPREELVAQFPGKVRKILVKPGQAVKNGDPLVLVEAMKMEFSIAANADGVIDKVLVQEGQQLAPGDKYVLWKDGAK